MAKPVINPFIWNTFRTLVMWCPLWIVTTILFGVLGGIYAFLLKSDQWLASQAIVVRDDAKTSVMRQADFNSESKIKAAQETFIELAKNYQVVKQALAKIGPEPTLLGTPTDWPTNADIQETVEQAVSVHAPKGIDLGKTDVIYLDVKQKSQERAIALNRAICDALDLHMKNIRTDTARTIVFERESARDSARIELERANERLQEVEQKTGSDLSDLRGLIERGGSANARTQLDHLITELRFAETDHQKLENEWKQLEESSRDRDAFLAAPSSLFANQPGLVRLRDGLVDAQLAFSQLAGKFTDQHPSVIAARRSLDEVVKRLNIELQLAVKTAQQALLISRSRIDRLNAQMRDLEERLKELAHNRSNYEVLVSEVRTKTSILENAERLVAEAQAIYASCESTSCFTRLDEPVLRDKPVGPSRTLIAVGSTFAGWAIGIGLVFLIAPMDFGHKFGRRAADRLSTAPLPIAIVPAAVPESANAPSAAELISMIQRPPEAAPPEPPKPELKPQSNEQSTSDANTAAKKDIRRPIAMPLTAQEMQTAGADILASLRTVKKADAAPQGTKSPDTTVDRRQNPRKQSPAPIPPITFGIRTEESGNPSIR